MDLVLPGKCVTAETVAIRIKAPKGSYGGIGYEPERLASTGAARIWIREGTEKPPSIAGIASTSAWAGKLGLPDRGVVGHSAGRIRASGFAAPCRILGESEAAAVIIKSIGKGLYGKCEITIEETFPVERMARFVEAFLDPTARASTIPPPNP